MTRLLNAGPTKRGRSAENEDARDEAKPRLLRLVRSLLGAISEPASKDEPASPSSGSCGESDTECDTCCSVLFRAESSPPPSPFFFSINKEGASARKSLEMHFSQSGAHEHLREGLAFPKYEHRPSVKVQ